MVIDNVRETVSVTWAKIYRKTESDKRPDRTTKAATSLVHYLIAKYGFYETFENYLGFRPIVGTAEINDRNYNFKDYVIVSSSGVKPKTFIGKILRPYND